MGAVHITVEKSFLRDDEETDIALSPIKSQVTVMEKGSMETTITSSKTKISGDFTVR